jgi:hypothetical protein
MMSFAATTAEIQVLSYDAPTQFVHRDRLLAHFFFSEVDDKT